MTLVLGGDYNEFIMRAFFNMVPIALINETNPRFNALEKFALTKYSFLMLENYNFIHFLRKAHRFVLVSSSQPLLRSLLQVNNNIIKYNKYIIKLNICEKETCIIPDVPELMVQAERG